MAQINPQYEHLDQINGQNPSRIYVAIKSHYNCIVNLSVFS